MFSLLMKSKGYWAHQCRPVNHSGNLAILEMKKSPVKEKDSDEGTAPPKNHSPGIVK